MFRGLLIDDWIHKFFYVVFVIAYNAYSDFYPKKEKKRKKRRDFNFVVGIVYSYL